MSSSIDSLNNFKANRLYPNYNLDTVDVDYLKSQYKANIKKSVGLNAIAKDKDILRIMTYNVHFWTDVNEIPNIDKILQDIKTINPDIVCLNEVTLGKTKYNNKDIIELFEKLHYDGDTDPSLIYENYELLSFVILHHRFIMRFMEMLYLLKKN